MAGDRPLEVLFVVHGYPPARGGTEQAVAQLASRLVSIHGDSVRVFTADALGAGGFADPHAPRLAAGDSRVDGVATRRFRSLRAFGPLLRQLQRVAYRFRTPFHEELRTLFQGPILPGLERAIRETEADVVVASAFPLLHMYAALRAAHATGRPCVFLPALHPDDAWGFDRAQIHRAIRAADACLTYTEFERDYVIRRGAEEGRVQVLGLGVDAAALAEGDRDAMRRELGVPGEAPLLGFLGQLAPHKGADTLLRALPRVWEDHPGAHCLLAGAGTGFQAALAKQVEALPREQAARVHWRVDFADAERADLLAATDVIVSPSRYESFGLVFLEAWAAGKPVVAGAIPALRELVREGETGHLVTPGDAAALSGVLCNLLADPPTARRMGEAGRERVRSEHDWAVTTARLREALLGVVS